MMHKKFRTNNIFRAPPRHVPRGKAIRAPPICTMLRKQSCDCYLVSDPWESPRTAHRALQIFIGRESSPQTSGVFRAQLLFHMILEILILRRIVRDDSESSYAFFWELLSIARRASRWIKRGKLQRFVLLALQFILILRSRGRLTRHFLHHPDRITIKLGIDRPYYFKKVS